MIEIRDATGAPVRRDGDLWVVEEARRYEVRGADRILWDRIELPALGGRAFALDLGHHVGQLALEFEIGAESGSLHLDVRPRPEKLSPELWLQLVEDLEDWLPAVTVGLQPVRDGGVGPGGVSAGWLAEALLPLVPLLERAICALSDGLRIRAQSRVEDRPLRTARQVRRETMVWLARHQQAAAWLDGWSEAELKGRPPDVPLRRSYDTLDHPANRHLHWLLRRVVSALAVAADRLDRIHVDEEIARWCEARAKALRAASEGIALHLRRSPLSTVPPRPGGEAALNVFVDDPSYARVYALARRFLSPRFSLAEEENPATVRPSFGLYELWCLLAMERALRAARPAWTWRTKGFSALLDPTGTGAGAGVTGEHDVGRLELLFNATFASYSQRAGRDRWSLSGERRPDFVARWSPKGGDPRWLVLDAKYRVGANLVDAFESVHIYRDALRWGSARCLGGALLAPSETADTREFFSLAHRAEHGIGAFTLRPGALCGPLVDWVLGTLHAE